MQIPAFLQKFGRDIVYLCVIGCMAAWIWVDGKRESICNEMIARDLSVSRVIINRHNDFIFSEIQMRMDTEDKDIEGYIDKKFLARKSIEDFESKVYELASAIGTNNREKMCDFKRSATDDEIESLELASNRLRDTLLSCMDNDPSTIINFSDVFSEESANTFFNLAKTSNKHEIGMLLADMRLSVAIANTVTLEYLSHKTSPGIICTYWYPIVSAEKSAILPGQTYNAKIFLSQYSMYEPNTTIKVNGKPYPIKDGLVHFSQRYTTPGEKKYKVEIEIKNPVTNEVKSFKEEFALLVVDSCR